MISRSICIVAVHGCGGCDVRGGTEPGNSASYPPEMTTSWVETASPGHVPEFEVEEAQARLDELIDRAVAGEEIVVTSDGVPLAVLESLRKQAEGPGSAPAR